MKKIILFMPLMAFSLLTSCELPNPGSSSTYHVVSFDSNGGSFIQAVQVEDGKTVKTPDEPIRDQYEFAGWQLNGTDYKFTEPVKEDIVLKALWEGPTPIVTHKVIFHFNNDTGSGEQTEIREVTEGNNIIRPTWVPTYEGYNFINWYQQAQGGSVYDFPGTMGDTDVDIYAHWKVVPVNYSIFFSGTYCKAYRSGVSPSSAGYLVQLNWNANTSDSYNIVLVPDDNYKLPESITVLFGNTEGIPETDYEYKPDGKTLSIKKKANALISLTAIKQ